MRLFDILAIVLLLVLGNMESSKPDYLFNVFSISSLTVLVLSETRRGNTLKLPYGARFQLGLLNAIGELIHKTTGSRAYAIARLAEIERQWFKKSGTYHSLLSELLKGRQVYHDGDGVLRYLGDEAGSPKVAVKTFLSDLEKELSKTLVLREDKMSIVLALGLFIPMFMALIHGLIGVKNLTYLAISLVTATRLVTRRLVAQ